ncbi:hypothetical protein [Pelagicoccus sp. SDUM812002]|uniref:hypothetical protein n=1 Tax=Pelagicoccus sp. SDUM812002 TaxID=3041266 RepID=UPI00280DE2A7|nr:hypothetical protein [Pelagicoccus sp. SDUM812002]MDQ8186438.1 hypothetical protein [Pelagicoccus sp. SDUM812002]
MENPQETPNPGDGYFLNVHRLSIEFLDKLALPKEPYPIDVISNELRLKLEDRKDVFTSSLRDYSPLRVEARLRDDVPVGMNTVGMLADRWTILILKEWCLRNKLGKTEAATELVEKQTTEILAALRVAVPGNSSLNSKLTHLGGYSKADNWEEAFAGLFTINILLWESQETLYQRDLEVLPGEELRKYIQFFSRGNVERNEYIELCESRYWTAYE